MCTGVFFVCVCVCFFFFPDIVFRSRVFGGCLSCADGLDFRRCIKVRTALWLDIYEKSFQSVHRTSAPRSSPASRRLRYRCPRCSTRVEKLTLRGSYWGDRRRYRRRDCSQQPRRPSRVGERTRTAPRTSSTPTSKGCEYEAVLEFSVYHGRKCRVWAV